MKSSIVYTAVTLRTFVRFETGIWLSTELKKSRHFLTASQWKKTFWSLVILLVVKESFERYSCLEFILKNSKHCEAGLKLKLNELKVLFHDRIFKDTSLSIHVFVNKNVLWSVSLNYISVSWLFVKISFLSLCRLLFSFSCSINMACRSTQLLRLYGVLEVKCKGKYKFGAWQNSEVEGWTGDFGNLIKIRFFLKVFAQSPALPCILHNSRMTWLNSPVRNGEVSICCCHFIICCGREARASIVLK